MIPILLIALLTQCAAEDWPMRGRDGSRNMVAEAKNLPVDILLGERIRGTEDFDLSKSKNVRWVAKIGEQSYLSPSVGSGKILVGTNNQSPRDPEIKGSWAVLMCFDEGSGEFLWQLLAPTYRPRGRTGDCEHVGLLSSPAIEKDRAWVVTPRGLVICVDLNGMADGNDGPFKDEAALMTEKPTAAKPDPIIPKLTDKHADVLWVFDMLDPENGIRPGLHWVASCSPLIVGDILYANTSNGVDWSHRKMFAPSAPGLIALDKNTGKLLGREDTGASARTLHSNWSAPAMGKVNGKDLVMWGGGDGFAYGLETSPSLDKQKGYRVLKEVWRYDANPPEYRHRPDGSAILYARHRNGPSEILGGPAFHDGLVYFAIGQEPDHGYGKGMLSCVDPSGRGDISGKAVWTYRDIGFSMATPSVADGLVYIAEKDGKVHCVDAKTGLRQWVHDTGSPIYGSTLVADGKVFVGTSEDGELVILKAGRKHQHLNTIQMPAQLYDGLIAANDTLYVKTGSHIWALATIADKE